MSDLDAFDRRILAALQEDSRLTNNDLAERVGLSPSQCSRRRQRLEDDGVIAGYSAFVTREKVGFGLVSIIFVSLATHNRDNAVHFARLVADLPEVLEAHALTGEMDYMLKVVTADLKALTGLVNNALLPHEVVQNVRTAIVLDTLKETTALPL